MPRVVVHTDGACEPNPGFGGWAAILQFTNKQGKTTSKAISGNDIDTTNNRMEIMPVLASLKLLKYPCHVKVYSDSNYVVKAIGDWCNGEPDPKRVGWIAQWKKHGWVRPGHKFEDRELKNKDLWQLIYAQLLRHTSVSMRWVRGHAGNELNELCDALAVEERVKAANGILETRT